MAKFKALYLEDDVEIQKLVSKTLPDSLECLMASTLEDAKKLIQTENFHLVLIDLRLDHGTGIDFLEHIKQTEFLFIPSLLVITSSSDENDEIRCHEMDVFEYIKKPINIKILQAQLAKHLRRFESHSLRRLGNLVIDEQKMEVKEVKNDVTTHVPLTGKEYKLLMTFINNPKKAYSRDELMSEVWNTNCELQTRTVDMHISTLKKKLGSIGEAISTIRGVGYSFNIDKVSLV